MDVFSVLVLDFIESVGETQAGEMLMESIVFLVLSKFLNYCLYFLSLLAFALGKLSEPQSLVLTPRFSFSGGRQLSLNDKLFGKSLTGNPNRPLFRKVLNIPNERISFGHISKFDKTESSRQSLIDGIPGIISEEEDVAVVLVFFGRGCGVALFMGVEMFLFLLENILLFHHELTL